MSHSRMRELSPYDMHEAHSWPRWDIPPEMYGFDEQWKRAQAGGTGDLNKWDRRRRTIVDRVEKLRKDAVASREQIVHDSLTQLQASHIALLAVGHPTHPDYLFRLHELSIQRDLQLSNIKQEADHRKQVAHNLYKQEVERIEDEYEHGKRGVKEKLLEACEERTKKLREEKDGVELNFDNLFDTQARTHATRQHRNHRAAQRSTPGGYSELGNGPNAESQSMSRSGSSVPLPAPDGSISADLIFGVSLLPGSSVLNHLPALAGGAGGASSSNGNGNGNNNGTGNGVNGLINKDNAWLSTLAALPYRVSGRGRRNYASSANMPTWFSNPAAHGLPTHAQLTNIQPGKYESVGKPYVALKAIPADDVTSDLEVIRKKRRLNGQAPEQPARRAAAGRKYDKYL